MGSQIFISRHANLAWELLFWAIIKVGSDDGRYYYKYPHPQGYKFESRVHRPASQDVCGVSGSEKPITSLTFSR